MGLYDSIDFTDYLEEVKRHIEGETEVDEQRVRENYQAGFSVHETVSQIAY